MISRRYSQSVLPGLVALLLCAVQVSAQDNPEEVSNQLWGNFILARPVSEKLYIEYDFEGARQVDGGTPWKSMYGTGLFEYYPKSFIDLTGEFVTGFADQTPEEDSYEATARLGFRLHLINQFFNSPAFAEFRPERMSGKRFSIANLMRLEWRNFWYSDDRPSSHDTRFRNRLETKLALNKESFAEDGVWHLMADIEWFVALEDEDIPERFATKKRVRLGVGYRHSYRWRFDVLAMWDDVRETPASEGEREAHMLNFRAKLFF